MQNSNKGFVLPLIIGVVTLLLIGGGLYYWQKTQSPLSNKSERVYSNDAGYTVMYPSQATITEAPSDPDHIFISNSPTFTFNLNGIGSYTNATASFTIDSIGNTCPGYLMSIQNTNASSSVSGEETIYYNPNPGQPSFGSTILGHVSRYYLIYRNNSSCYLISTDLSNPSYDIQFTQWFESTILPSFELTNASPNVNSSFGGQNTSTAASSSANPAQNSQTQKPNPPESDTVAITAATNAFKQAFLDANQTDALKYSSEATQYVLNINQLNTAYKSLTIKSISMTSSNQAEVVLASISNTGIAGNLYWGFVNENGVWKFDLSLTEKFSHSSH